MSAVEILDEREGLPSASAMERIKLCPPSYLRGKSRPRVEDDSTEDSRAGDRIHDALANWAKAWFSNWALGEIPEVIGFCDDLSSDETKTAEIMAGQAVKVVVDFFDDGQPLTDFIVERRLWLCDADGGRLVSAKPDIVLISDERALCLDWKSGHNAVSHASRNIQLRTLVLTVAYETGATSVRVGIVQSWAGKPHTCDYGTADIEAAYAEHLQIRELADQGEAVAANPGVEQCRYCSFARECEERQKWLQGAMPATIRELPLAKVWGPQEWCFFLDNEGAARKWLDEKKAEAKRILAEKPEAIPTHTLKPGTPRSSIGSVDVVYSRFVAAGGSAQKFAAVATISKKALGELVGSELKLKGKARDSKVEEITKDCTKQGNTPEPTIERRAA